MVERQSESPAVRLQARADLLAAVRDFFRQRQVMEVETPLLCATTATDPHLDSIAVDGVFLQDSRRFFLQTSPEFAMKKLLAAGSGSIYQVCKAFRRDERGRRHHPEFTMLEWYRTGFDEQQLMDEVAELVSGITGRPAPRRTTYRQLFQQTLELDPHDCSDEALTQEAHRHIDFDSRGYSRDELLHLLLAEVVEPALVDDCFVYDFPACLAALARIAPDTSGVPVACRFELFMDGMEIANGYWELTDAAEQRRRFEADLNQRARLGRESLPLDEELVAALERGLPDCAGVALGLDRLLMIVSGARQIDDVLVGPLSTP